MIIEENELWKLQQAGFKIVKFIPSNGDVCDRIEEWNEGDWIYYAEYNDWESSSYIKQKDKFYHNPKVIVLDE